MTTSPHAVERTHPPDALMRLVNPVMRRILASPLHRAVSRDLLLLRYEGRRSGRTIELPVGRQEHGGRPAAFSNSGWRYNFRGGHPAALVEEGRTRRVTGTLIEDADEVAGAYVAIIDGLGWKAAQRRLGITVTVGRSPTREELVDVVRRSGLSIVVFDAR